MVGTLSTCVEELDHVIGLLNFLILCVIDEYEGYDASSSVGCNFVRFFVVLHREQRNPHEKKSDEIASNIGMPLDQRRPLAVFCELKRCSTPRLASSPHLVSGFGTLSPLLAVATLSAGTSVC